MTKYKSFSFPFHLMIFPAAKFVQQFVSQSQLAHIVT